MIRSILHTFLLLAFIAQKSVASADILLINANAPSDGDGEFDYVASQESVQFSYRLDDVQGSTVAMMNRSSVIIDRNSYSPYGETRHHVRYDVNGDGGRDAKDIAIVAALAGFSSYPLDPTDIDEAGYRAEADLDRDGDIDTADYNLINGMSADSGLGAGVLSPTNVNKDNIIGYHGYCFNLETQQYDLPHAL